MASTKIWYDDQTVEDGNQLIKSHQRKPEQVDIGIEGI